MDLKEFIFKGGSLEYPYVDTEDGWVGTAKIHCFGDEVIVEVPSAKIRGRKDFDLKEIDKAIDFYISLIKDKNNRCSRWK